MCVKIITAEEEFSYDMNRPLEEQLDGSKKIIVTYEPQDPSIDKFFDEVERLCKDGASAKLNIVFNHGNSVAGAKLKKELSALSKDLDLNEVIKMMVTSHSETDKRLEEMANYCMDGNCRVKKNT